VPEVNPPSNNSAEALGSVSLLYEEVGMATSSGWRIVETVFCPDCWAGAQGRSKGGIAHADSDDVFKAHS